jgi:hypothetical protein
MKNINNKVLIYLGGVILGFGLIIFLATSIVPKALVTISKASGPGTVSLANSYVIGEKILATSDGKDKCKINVFVVDTSGKGISGKSVSLKGMTGVTPSAAVTDGTGRASFSMASLNEGQFVISASVGGAEISKKVTVTFRKD